jgi:WD40 repeat protein
VAFSPDGHTVLTGSWDDTARLWDARTGKHLGEPLRHKGWVLAVAFNPEGDTVLTGSRDKTAQLWDARTGKPLGDPLRHQGEVWAVAFSPEGHTVLTGSEDNTARLWDARTGEPLGDPLRHQGEVQAVAFSPDGKHFVTACAGNSFHGRGRQVSTGMALLWQAPAPLQADVRHIRLWVEVNTGLELDSQGVVRALDAPAWQERWKALQKLHDPLLP